MVAVVAGGDSTMPPVSGPSSLVTWVTKSMGIILVDGSQGTC